ncbi:6-O-methylguanine DNA methyltransferase [Scheffersomyces coipomensis]|uniref:6-O-methylguanine DNA methyltransferase n=1 Tax=Scheffersomyces coipomensis TaxID=1788519 RepID=UPI00315D38D1
MDRLTDESKNFHHAVYTVVSKIPYGHVTSYGHIAYLLNKPQNSRQVGSSLKHYQYYNLDTLPWWRVINSVGKISPRGNSNGEYVQAERLRDEGVIVSSGHKIDLEDFGWFPDELDF